MKKNDRNHKWHLIEKYLRCNYYELMVVSIGFWGFKQVPDTSNNEKDSSNSMELY